MLSTFLAMLFSHQKEMSKSVTLCTAANTYWLLVVEGQQYLHFQVKKYFILNSKNSDKWIGDLDKV